ncbi:Elongation factor P domain protein [Theileria parva strain Muguga]|uniref:Elongation factor P C-terminal domain-containing protein n=1 Tax=Theileria parva TaxID=5875 RepID=Q4N046_THEPA|nr:Elongation factor P domain protein [Theileria parva strain Muguga]EAN31043.1 Elongation factor P domain protein [Theileria parva strain Muguga]|eukprot:XP_763326.1 hypothetical protein [Theileria parva strain Muguga]
MKNGAILLSLILPLLQSVSCYVISDSLKSFHPLHHPLNTNTNLSKLNTVVNTVGSVVEREVESVGVTVPVTPDTVTPDTVTEPPDTLTEPRKLSTYERKRIMHKILHERNKKLISDLISKCDPADLIPYRSKSRPKSRTPRTSQVTPSVTDDTEFEDSVITFDDVEPTQINHVKSGSYVFYKGEVYTVVSIQHIAQARTKGHYKVKMHLLHTNKENSFSFPDASKLTVVVPNKVNCTYSHFDLNSNLHIFHIIHNVDSGNSLHSVSPGVTGDNSGKYDNSCVTGSVVGVNRSLNIPALKYLKPGLKVSISRWKDKILSVYIPFHIEYKVVKINTGNYAATLDNGLVVLVPTYIKVNDHIEITTKAGEFLRRTKIA